jgi:hypothetical protein
MILNRESNFGVRARSAPNFLAFNRQSRGRGPEVITFAEPQRRVLIFAAAGDQGQGPDTFSITGSLKSQTVARASLEVSGRQYGRLKVVSETGIDSVRIRGHHANVFVLDDLRFSPVR